ncbi:MAG: glutathione S-transferase [Sphingopyxis sp.]
MNRALAACSTDRRGLRAVPLPILYSFRRCPYAMRARMALHAADVAVAHREVALRAKPAAMLAASAKGTVPVLILPDGTVVDESLDIMRWALARHDPAGWLEQDGAADGLIATNDGPFKHHLDRMKYANRYDGADPAAHRVAGMAHLAMLNDRLAGQPWLTGAAVRLADIAIFPFVRQFARADGAAWAAEPVPNLQRWLDSLVQSPLFSAIMARHTPWVDPQQTDCS